MQYFLPPILNRLESTTMYLAILLSAFFIPDCFLNRHITSGVIIIAVYTIIIGLINILFNRRLKFNKSTIFILPLIIILGISQCQTIFLPILDNIHIISLFILLSLLNTWEFDNNKIVNYFLFMTIIVLIMCTWGILQHFHLVKFFFKHPSGTGSFDNPTGIGIFSAIIFPFCIYLIHNNSKAIKILAVCASAIIILTIILSQSRTALVAILIIGIWYMFLVTSRNKYFKVNRYVFYIIVTLASIILLWGIYNFKIDSANGRLLIWNISWQMFKSNWFFGMGAGTFQSQYMLYQAEFFKSYPNNEFVILMDNVNHPFNEYLKFLIEYGILGSLIFISYIILIIRGYWFHLSNPNITPVFLSIIATGIAAFFSYPMKYPVINLILIVNLSILQSVCFKREYIKGKLRSVFLKIALATTLLGIGYFILNASKMEYLWCKTARSSQKGNSEQNISIYTRLNNWMKYDGLFLYNYGAELNFTGRYIESNMVLSQCCQLFNDTDVNLLIADNYLKLKKMHEAECHLILAHHMHPVRFYPLYQLFLLYIEFENTQKAIVIGEKILSKSIKIQSPLINFIKNDVKHKLISMYKNDQISIQF